MKLCACITEKTAEKCIKVAKALDTELIEHRIDFMNKMGNLESIYNTVEVPVIATNRSLKCGGQFIGSEEDRIAILLDAINAGCAMVDIEIETDSKLKQEVISKAKENNCQVMISMHDHKKTPDTRELLRIMQKERKQGADIGKIVAMANSVEDCHRILGLMLEAKKESFPLIAFAMGELGRFTRIVALLYSAPFVYASTGEKAAPGQLSVSSMKKIQKELMPRKRLVVIGDPIEHSLSPSMHNAALKALGLENEFHYNQLRVKAEDLASFADKVRKGEITGANVTIPHKVSIVKHIDGVTKEAGLIGAVNTLFNRDGKVIGHNTDGIGCLNSLKEKGVDVNGKKIVILGAGGAARAIAFVFALNGAKELVVLNRTMGKAEKLVKEVREKTGVNIIAGDLEKIKGELKHADVLINCTSIGMKGKQEEKTLVSSGMLHPGLTVVDIVYNPSKTRLLEQAEKAGCKIVAGTGMLVHQGAVGLEIWTKRKPPIATMRKALLEGLK